MSTCYPLQQKSHETTTTTTYDNNHNRSRKNQWNWFIFWNDSNNNNNNTNNHNKNNTSSINSRSTTTSKNNDDHEHKNHPIEFICREICILLYLSIPSMIIQLCVFLPSIFVSSYIGRHNNDNNNENNNNNSNDNFLNWNNTTTTTTNSSNYMTAVSFQYDNHSYYYDSVVIDDGNKDWYTNNNTTNYDNHHYQYGTDTGNGGGSIYLDSYSIASTMINLFTVAFIDGILRSLKTLLPQMYGTGSTSCCWGGTTEGSRRTCSSTSSTVLYQSNSYHEIQYTIIRCFVCCCCIMLVTCSVLYFFMDPYILLYIFQENIQVTSYATCWYKHNILAIPFNTIFQITCTYLSSQNILFPQMMITVLCTFLFLPYLLHTLGEYFATTTNSNNMNKNDWFSSTALALVLYQFIQMFLLLIYVVWQQPHHPDTWPPLFFSSFHSNMNKYTKQKQQQQHDDDEQQQHQNEYKNRNLSYKNVASSSSTTTQRIISNAKIMITTMTNHLLHQIQHTFYQFLYFFRFIQKMLQYDYQMKLFIQLSISGIFASAFWIHAEVISLLVGQLSVTDLSAHVIAGQSLGIGFMIPLGLGIGLSIRMGHLLPVSYNTTRNVCWGSILFFIVFFLFIATHGFYTYRYTFYHLFTTDERIIMECEKIWKQVTIHYYNTSLFAITMGIATGLGQQWLVAVVSIVYLWIIGLPVTYWYGIRSTSSHQGLLMVWDTLWPLYGMINITLWILFLFFDWEQMGTEVRMREGTSGMEDLLLAVQEEEDNKVVESYPGFSSQNHDNEKKNLLVQQHADENDETIHCTSYGSMIETSV